MADERDGWGELLAEARAAGFVGRRAELAALAELLASEPSHRASYVYGPGGIGKTELLRELSRRAVAAEFRVVWIQGGRIEPTAEALAAGRSRGARTCRAGRSGHATGAARTSSG